MLLVVVGANEWFCVRVWLGYGVGADISSESSGIRGRSNILCQRWPTTTDNETDNQTTMVWSLLKMHRFSVTGA